MATSAAPAHPTARSTRAGDCEVRRNGHDRRDHQKRQQREEKPWPERLASARIHTEIRDDQVHQNGEPHDGRQPLVMAGQIGSAASRQRQDSKDHVRRDADQPCQPFRCGYHLPQVTDGGHSKGYQPYQDANRGTPLPPDEERGDERAHEPNHLRVRATAEQPVDDDRVVALARRSSAEAPARRGWARR